MKIALIGSAPSSIMLAPYGDTTWKIWGCSPGAYFQVPRSDVWFELHRWEPPVVGRPAQQKTWFSPEYCQWLAQHPCVYMAEPVATVPNSVAVPVEYLVNKYGHFWFTSSLAWMLAMAIEEIMNARTTRDPEMIYPNDEIGLWGVDMAAVGEYGYQRAGCQVFANIAVHLGITVTVPPESDLLVPPPLYGISENDHRAIKLLERQRELQNRLRNSQAAMEQSQRDCLFVQGALDDMNYHLQTWIHQGDALGVNFKGIFAPPPPPIAELKKGSTVVFETKLAGTMRPNMLAIDSHEELQANATGPREDIRADVRAAGAAIAGAVGEPGETGASFTRPAGAADMLHDVPLDGTMDTLGNMSASSGSSGN